MNTLVYFDQICTENGRLAATADLQYFYIQIKIYDVSDILLYFLIITIRHYRDDTKRSEITRLPHGYMKQNEDNTRNCKQGNNEGTKNIDEHHTTS